MTKYGEGTPQPALIVMEKTRQKLGPERVAALVKMGHGLYSCEA